eukprot:6213369-Pleurochrysis_carterae.AAC.2
MDNHIIIGTASIDAAGSPTEWLTSKGEKVVKQKREHSFIKDGKIVLLAKHHTRQKPSLVCRSQTFARSRTRSSSVP